ncbi:MAG: inositol monophosphatase family protein, partial [Deltaproteobacteria bacterium]|nr:inositol monophosphatase family protein [Deltaproteobacteria bacterium]
MTMTEDGQRAVEIAERVAREAGQLVMQGWRSGVEVSRKGRFDLLTEYDLASERLIRDQLSREFPTHRIIGEENAESGEGELVWYVDPIDGTTNFAHGHFFFGVSIALYRGSQGLAGVVHAPALGVTWK